MWAAAGVVLDLSYTNTGHHRYCSHCWRIACGKAKQLIDAITQRYTKSQHCSVNRARVEQSKSTVGFVNPSSDAAYICDWTNTISCSESDVIVDSPIALVAFTANATGSGSSAADEQAFRVYFQSAHGNVKESRYDGELAPWQEPK